MQDNKIYKNTIEEFINKIKDIWETCCNIFKEKFFSLYSACAKIEVDLEGTNDRVWLLWYGISLILNYNIAIH